MKKLLGFFVCACVGMVLLFAGPTGCTKSKDKDKDKTAGKKDVKLTAEAKATVKPGESHDHKLKLERGAEATNEVTFVILVTPADMGVTAKADKAAKDAKEGTLKIDVAKDAEAKDYTVKVTAKSTDSTESNATVTVTVPKKEGSVTPKDKDMKFAVKADPDEKLKITQDKKDAAKGTVKVSLTMGADLKKATVSAKVTDKDGKDVKGVMAKADVDSMKETGDAKVTVEVAADAMPGDYDLIITTVAEGGMPVASVDTKIKLTVEKAK
jgi:uncharacterized membrane protein